jgi:hypothetical protein
METPERADQLARAIVAYMEALHAELELNGGGAAAKERALALGQLKADMERFAAGLRARHHRPPPPPVVFMPAAPERLDGHIN